MSFWTVAVVLAHDPNSMIIDRASAKIMREVDRVRVDFKFVLFVKILIKPLLYIKIIDSSQMNARDFHSFLLIKIEME